MKKNLSIRVVSIIVVNLISLHACNFGAQKRKDPIRVSIPL